MACEKALRLLGRLNSISATPSSLRVSSSSCSEVAFVSAAMVDDGSVDGLNVLRRLAAARWYTAKSPRFDQAVLAAVFSCSPCWSYHGAARTLTRCETLLASANTTPVSSSYGLTHIGHMASQGNRRAPWHPERSFGSRLGHSLRPANAAACPASPDRYSAP